MIGKKTRLHAHERLYTLPCWAVMNHHPFQSEMHHQHIYILKDSDLRDPICTSGVPTSRLGTTAVSHTAVHDEEHCRRESIIGWLQHNAHNFSCLINDSAN